MSVTIKRIAELSGVSTGTVDRVLNGRGRVSAETAALVRKVADQLGYRPNRAGRALAAVRRPVTIGVLLTAQGIPFFDDVLRGVAQAAEEISDYGVTVLTRSIKGYDSAVQCAAIEELRGQVQALILNPIDDPAVVEAIGRVSRDGIPVFTINTDIEGSDRLCYIGSDYERSGAAACGMLGLMLPPESEIGVLTGSIKVLGHNQRIAGFRRVLKSKYPTFRVADIFETNDDDFVAFQVTRELLEAHPRLNGIFVAAAGTYGVCRAVLSLHREQSVSIVSMDCVPSTCEMLQKGIIRATICQQPVIQGYQAVQRAFSYLITGEPPENYIVANEIVIAENL